MPLDDLVECFGVAAAVPNAAGEDAGDGAEAANARALDLQNRDSRLIRLAPGLCDRAEVLPALSHLARRSAFRGFLIAADRDGQDRTRQPQLLGFPLCRSRFAVSFLPIVTFSQRCPLNSGLIRR